MRHYNVLDLFSGIAGTALAIEKSKSFKTVAYCDNCPNSQKVLKCLMDKKNIHKAPIFSDVKKLYKKDLPKIHMISASWPCQGSSSIGKIKNLIYDDRSSLILHVLRLTQEIKPNFLFLENVKGLLVDPSYLSILHRLRELGYDLAFGIFDASNHGAQHRRKRWVCYAKLPHAPHIRISSKNPLTQHVGRITYNDLQENSLSGVFTKLLGNSFVPATAYEALYNLINFHRDSNNNNNNFAQIQDIVKKGSTLRFLWKNKDSQPKIIQIYKETPICTGGPFVISSLKFPQLNTSRPCIPTPRTPSHTARSSLTPSKRAVNDFATFVALMRPDYKPIVLHPQKLIAVMGFPNSWYEAMLEADVIFTKN